MRFTKVYSDLMVSKELNFFFMSNFFKSLFVHAFHFPGYGSTESCHGNIDVLQLYQHIIHPNDPICVR